jgi:hypothetical protein
MKSHPHGESIALYNTAIGAALMFLASVHVNRTGSIVVVVVAPSTKTVLRGVENAIAVDKSAHMVLQEASVLAAHMYGRCTVPYVNVTVPV